MEYDKWQLMYWSSIFIKLHYSLWITVFCLQLLLVYNHLLCYDPNRILSCVLCLATLQCIGRLLALLCVAVCVSVGFCVGCELTENGDQPKHVATRWGEIYMSVICAFVSTKSLWSDTVHGENSTKVINLRVWLWTPNILMCWLFNVIQGWHQYNCADKMAKLL